MTEGPSGEAAFRTEASERPVRNTRHPRVANCRTTSSPMPLLAPVTRAMPGIDKPPLIPFAIIFSAEKIPGWACPQGKKRRKRPGHLPCSRKGKRLEM